MAAVLLGIDIGTSACKVAAFTQNGTVLAQASEPYPVYQPQPGWAEQDPDEWWDAVCRAVRRTLEQKIKPQEIVGIGIDGQSWSAVPVAKDKTVLCRTPIWMDTRAGDSCVKMKQAVDEHRLFEVSKNPLAPTYTMPKVLWYRDHRPQVYEKTVKILQSNGYIAFCLTGVLAQDYSQGYGWSCYDMARGEWNTELCAELGIKPSLLPELMPCHGIVGGVTKEAAVQTGLMQGTPVVAGGLDAACGALGAGVIRPKETQEQGGQAGGMSICADVCRANERLILSAHVVPGRWLLQGGTVGGGGAVRWYAEQFGAQERLAAHEKGTHVLAELDEGASRVAPGCDGLVFLPYLSGERSPIWNDRAKGVFFGIDYAKTRAHFARAVMEGVAFSLRHNLETAQAAGVSAGELRAMGGAANSALWTQMKADVTKKTVAVVSADTATALGAAILAGVGTGVYAGFEEAVEQTVNVRRIYRPNPSVYQAYDRNYGVYRSLYENLQGLMNEVKTL